MAIKKTHEQFIKEVENVYGENIYMFHSEYKRSDKTLTVEHLECGYIWNVYPRNLINKQSKCPKCSNKANRSPDEFRKYVHNITNGEFSSIEDFKGNRYMTTFKHNLCGYTFQAMSQIAEREELGCRNCSGMLIHDKERVESLLDDKYGTEYVLLSDTVKNNRDTIEVKHSVCGNTFSTRSTDIIHLGKVCPHCNVTGSKGERKIEKYLKSLNLDFAREHSFFDCRHINELRFDFAVYDSLGRLDFLIEFDGRQHFEPVEFFGGQLGFELGKIRDEIKNSYCKNNNIGLLRIPYWKEDNINEIIQEYIKNKYREAV